VLLVALWKAGKLGPAPRPMQLIRPAREAEVR
jgi:hypothetical protein